MIAFIDLDNFKLINDRFGHNSGDLFLIQVGERLNTLQQNGEVIGRLGGDEFLVVSLNNENADISSLRERIQQQIRGEYHLGDVDLYYPGASLGIVEVDPETTDADSALHAADIAMYQEKKHKQKTPFCRASSATFLRRIHILLIGDNMRIGIIFPVVIFITAVVFLAWFLLAAMLPGNL